MIIFLIRTGFAVIFLNVFNLYEPIQNEKRMFENVRMKSDFDSLNPRFSTDIMPIIKEKCMMCHNATFHMGNVKLHDYKSILPYVKNESLIGSIRHEPDFKPMPSPEMKLEEEKIKMIENWIANGAKND